MRTGSVAREGALDKLSPALGAGAVRGVREASRDVVRAGDVACIPFVLFANVDRDRVADLRHLVQIRGIAELVVVDESCDRRVRVVLLLETQRTKRHAQRVEKEQTSDERLADS